MNKPIGLYLHVPFCIKKCLYCDFYSVSELEKRADYVKALARLIKESGKRLGRPLCDTVYFGGGTPSLLSTDELYTLLDAVDSSFDLKAQQITLEANPKTTDLQRLKEMRALGINRISLGIQSACDGELKTLGRLHNAEEALSCARDVYEAGFERLSVDLMYALPDQDMASVKQSLERILSLDPGHVSTYCLTLSDSSPLAKKALSYPDDCIQQQMYLYICERLEKAGINLYEISNFAKDGEESLHNLKYWSRDDVLGLGPGAYSLLQGRRFAFESNLNKFLNSTSEDMICDLELITKEDAANEYIMLSLRTVKGFQEKEFEALASRDRLRELHRVLDKKLGLWINEGLAVKTPCGFTLTNKGAFVSNYIISDLI